MKVIDHVKGYSTFVRGDATALWYRTDTGVLFPIPFDDIDGATLGATEKSTILMRWLRKYLEQPIATFQFFRAGNYWYTTEDGFEFPVPADKVCSMGTTEIQNQLGYYLSQHRGVVAAAQDARATA